MKLGKLWVALGLVLALAACSAKPAPACPVTEPNGSLPPGEQAVSADYLGNGSLWTVLPPNGRVVFEPGGAGEIRPDGSLAMKFPFWRGEGVTGELHITGQRLDAEAPALTAEIPDGYGQSGFQATGLVFPSAGCWQVTASVGEHELTFTTEVIVQPDSGS